MTDERFWVGETLEFTSKDNKKYQVNFRGYHYPGAVIVGKPSDKIGQMYVELSQLKRISP